jgi:hypothetical protein
MPAWVVAPIVILVESRKHVAARMAALAVLSAALVFGYAASQVFPPYAAHYRLQDRATVIVRAHAAHSDAPGDTRELRTALMQAVRGQGLEPYLADGDFHIDSTVSRIRLSCRYGVAVEILPGLRHTLRFRLHVEEPVLPKPGTIFL